MVVGGDRAVMKHVDADTHTAFDRTEHRPWPLPEGRWSWRQSWRDLLFAHWPIPAERLQPLVPAPLVVQEYEGTSWVGVVPFAMQGVMRRPLPDLPYFSAFPELNLRLYVEVDGKPGVWFLSLDAANAVAVWAARRFFHLPYEHARIAADSEGDEIRFDSSRRGSSDPVRFRAGFRPTSEPHESRPGTLEHWLTERYCLYAQSPRGELFRADVHHVPWPLQSAEAEIELNELTNPFGIELAGEPPLLHFSKRIDVVVWGLETVADR